MKKKDVILAVANQIQNMMYNDINCDNGVECFEAWCADGEVFENEGLHSNEVAQCMKLVREVAPIVDNLVLNHLNIDEAKREEQFKKYFRKNQKENNYTKKEVFTNPDWCISSYLYYKNSIWNIHAVNKKDGREAHFQITTSYKHQLEALSDNL